MQALYNKPYGFSYALGMYTVLPTNKLTVNDVITRADEQMYQEKLRYRRTQLAELEDVSDQDLLM